MNFNLIEMDKWERKNHYEYYIGKVKCHYTLNYNIKVTNFEAIRKKKNIKMYPCLLYAVSKAINSNKEFRMAYDENGNLGYFDKISPSYTIFHEDDKTFSDIWTEYDDNFYKFYNNVIDDMEKYKNVKGIKAKPNQPINTCPISSVPWLSFSGYSIDTPNFSPMLIPIITMGKLFHINDDCFIPFSIYVNHAVADGYHTCKLINEIEQILNELLIK